MKIRFCTIDGESIHKRQQLLADVNGTVRIGAKGDVTIMLGKHQAQVLIAQLIGSAVWKDVDEKEGK